MGEIIKVLSEEDQRFNLAKDEALSAISGAKTTIEQAEKALIKIPWKTQKPINRSRASKQRNPALEHSYRYLDSAGIAYQEITDPEIEYNNSVEKAVRDLRERVSPEC